MFRSQAPRLAGLAAAALLLALPALAQNTATPDGPPARNAEVWNGLKHPPTGASHADEPAAGMDSTPGEQRAQAEEVEQLQHQILLRAQQGTNDGIMSSDPNGQTAR